MYLDTAGFGIKSNTPLLPLNYSYFIRFWNQAYYNCYLMTKRCTRNCGYVVFNGGLLINQRLKESGNILMFVMSSLIWAECKNGSWLRLNNIFFTHSFEQNRHVFMGKYHWSSLQAEHRPVLLYTLPAIQHISWCESQWHLNCSHFPHWKPP